ncbi:MAG: hypothetical protein H6842_03695 [Rhodospirillaceae bacterium]|nr:hypothetical protein [Rhodospirillaceae bacterium]
MSQLFNRAMERLSGGFEGLGRERRIAAAQDAVRKALSDWPAADVEAFLSKGYAPIGCRLTWTRTSTTPRSFATPSRTGTR